jgi:hypothetical protein
MSEKESNTMSLTGNEKKMLDNIARNDFNGNPDEPVWSNCLDDGPHGEFVPRSSFGGIVSSLRKKGLVECDNGWQDSEGTVCLTAKGVEAWQALSEKESNTITCECCADLDERNPEVEVSETVKYNGMTLCKECYYDTIEFECAQGGT